MDLKKIGNYIAGKRKACGLTQKQVAEKLGMSDKSVSKWERGICLPDVSVYLELCTILGISLNEFIAGEDIQEQNVVKQSEDNLIQVAEDGTRKHKKLRRIIGLLICITAVVVCLLAYVACKTDLGQTNYIEPISKDSAEMKMAEVLSGVDGAFIYNFSTDQSYKELSLTLSTYKKGELQGEAEVMNLSLEQTDGQLDEQSEKQSGSQNGMIAVIPDFEQFQVKVIITYQGAKYATDYDILEGVKGRQYYGRTATEIGERVEITEKQTQGLLALIYGRNSISAVPIEIESIDKGQLGAENDYTYYFSYCFR